MPHAVRISAWAGFSELVEDLGADPASVLEAAGLTLDDIEKPDGYLDCKLFIRTLNAGAEQTGRTDFGMLSARAAGVHMFGVLGVAIKNAATLREALDICSRFIQINTTATSLTRAPIPGSDSEMVVLDNAYPLGPETFQLYERVLATILEVARTAGSPPEIPVEYRFMHGPISPVSAYVDILGSEPMFNQPSMGIVIHRDLLDAEIANRSLELGEMAMDHMRSLTDNAEKPFIDSARHICRVLIELGSCSQSQLATALKIHERTLQRRLKEAGSSFETVRDEARREIATVLLRQNAHSLTEIALILGYADSSTFSRSCQRWFGDTPSSIRAQAIGS